MKKIVSLALAAALSFGLLSVSASATFKRGETKVWIPDEPGYTFHSANLKLSEIPASEYITEAEMNAAVANAEAGLIPAGATVSEGRLAVIEQRRVTAPDADLPIQITFSVEEANKLSLCVFYKADSSDEWVLVSAATPGPVIECEFPENGIYAVAWGW